MIKSKAVVAMSARASGAIGLLAIAWLAARQLSATELGFFFSFLSFGALVQLADFGLSYASLQTGGRLAGTGRLNELPRVARHVMRWNVVALCLATTAVAVLGWATFTAGARSPAVSIPWRGPWVGYLLGVFVTQLTAPGISLREGSGKVAEMWRLRFVQEWIGALACVFAIHGGAGLWSLTFYGIARATVAAVWIAIVTPLRSETNAPSYTSKQWISEIWPFQWKIGLSGLAGFLIFRAFSPIIMLEKGPVLAGEFGLAISIMNILLGVSSAWPMSHAPRYAAFIASGRFEALSRDFPSMFWASTAFSLAGAIAANLALWWARERAFAFALRLPAPSTTAIILLTAVAHHVVFCLAMFLRAEGREPMLIPSAVGSIVTAFAIWLAAHFGTARDIAAVNLFLALAGIPVAFLLLRSRHTRLVASMGRPL